MASISRTLGRLVGCRALLGAGLALSSVGAAPGATPSADARRYARESAAALANHDLKAALALMEKAVALRPDHQSYLTALAGLQMVNQRPSDATATLNQLARMGLSLSRHEDESFAPLRDSPEFRDVARQLRANRDPLGPGRVLFELPAMTGIIEGIACRVATGDYFFGDVRHRCIWRQRPDGSVRPFSPAGAGLFGVFGLAVDQARGSLWAATTAVEEMEGYRPADRNRAALVEFALADGRVRRSAALPADGAGHVLGDLTVAADGTVYATDSLAPVIWRLPPEAAQPQRWLQSDEFESLQGIGVLAGGTTLVVSDYGKGVFLIDRATRAIRLLTPPPDSTLLGVDGLAAVPDGSVVAVQNGTEPRRVIRLRIDAAARMVVRLDVLERGHPAMADPTLGTLVGDQFVFVGNAGWDRFAPGGPADPAAPRAIPILATRLPAPPRK